MTTKRQIANWEKQSFIQLMFPHKHTHWAIYLDEILPIFEQIAKTIAKYQKCLVCFSDESTISNIINEKNIIFEKVKSNDTWCRDFGAISIKRDNQITLLDFKFNGWGEKYEYNLDNDITKTIFKDTKPIDFILEGGSIDTNGDNVILTTSTCLLQTNRNNISSKTQIGQKLHEYLGTKEIIWLDYGFLQGDDTNSHIDMFARFINKDTICYIKCDDKNDIHYNELQKMQNQLKQTRFKLIPLPWVEAKYYQNQRLPASYANFVILNGAVLVPTYQDKNDKKALDIFKAIFVSRDIISIDCSKIIRQNGSLHCLTMEYFNL